MPWIIEHAAQLKNRYMVGADGRTPTERLRGSVLCMSLARKYCSYLFLLPDQENLAQGSTMGSTWAADHSMARRTLEHLQE